MDKLIIVVNEYPLTSFLVFLGIYILLSVVVGIVETIFKIKTK